MPRGLGELLRERAAADPRGLALRMPGGPSWTWERYAAEAAAIQRGLARLGVQPGERIALMCDNSTRMAALLCAITGFGAVAIPVNTSLVAGGLAHVLNDSDACLLVADPPYLARCESLEGLAMVRCRHRISTADTGAGDAWSAHFPQEQGELMSRGGGADTALVMYTSGTTGRSKGVQLSHACVLHATEASATVMFQAQPSDVLYTCLPLFHCAAQRLGMWTSLRSGAQLVLAPGFSASTFWDQIRSFGVTKFHFIGPMTSILWKAPPTLRDADHPARLAVGGGPRLAYREFEERFGVTFVECYGMTETFGGCVSHAPGQGRAGSVGRALSHVEVSVRGDDGAPVPAGSAGEICIRPRYPHAIFSGYCKQPEATAQAMRGGWFRTGDLGSQDADGYLRFIARSREIIRRRGENISPVEVETVISRHPQVGECAVAGVPAELGEEDILAVIVPAGRDIDLRDVVAFARDHLAAFAVPRFVAIAQNLPKTSTSRVQRHELARFLADAVDVQTIS